MNKYEKAIAEIKDHAEHNLKVKLSVETATIVVQALEKQIPKSIVVKEILIYNKKQEFYRCPECNTYLDLMRKYCTGCGQKLDWSGKDE